VGIRDRDDFLMMKLGRLEGLSYGIGKYCTEA